MRVRTKDDVVRDIAILQGYTEAEPDKWQTAISRLKEVPQADLERELHFLSHRPRPMRPMLVRA